jgi:ferredoxin-NADP reductase
MTVAEVNALLYSSNHPRDRLERALKIEALSPGWRWSFKALLQSQLTAAKGGNAGLAPPAAAHPSAPGFRSLAVAAITQESADVLSLTFQNRDVRSLPAALPGQYVVLRLEPTMGATPIYRSYSLSGPVSNVQYRISVKIKPNAVAGNFLRERVRVGDVLDVSSPRGSFVLKSGDRPVVLLSAGIGATPVLAMLHTLAAAYSTRDVLWLHAARDRKNHPFAAEVRRLMHALAHGRSYVCYSRPGVSDKIGEDFDATGHLSLPALEQVGVQREADVYLCGPARFMADMRDALLALNVPPERIYAEPFNGSESMTPGVVGSAARSAHLPDRDVGTGSLVSFARSGIVAHWDGSAYQSILELAEACDVPVRWSCRTGVCHNCESGFVSGMVSYEPEPLDYPADGNVLVCCSRPTSDIVIDL